MYKIMTLKITKPLSFIGRFDNEATLSTKTVLTDETLFITDKGGREGKPRIGFSWGLMNMMFDSVTGEAEDPVHIDVLSNAKSSKDSSIRIYTVDIIGSKKNALKELSEILKLAESIEFSDGEKDTVTISITHALLEIREMFDD